MLLFIDDWAAWYTTIAAMLGYLLTLLLIPVILRRKKDPTAASAWCLMVLLVPIVGTIFYLLFGLNHIHRPLRRIQRRSERFTRRLTISMAQAQENPAWQSLGTVSRRVGASPITTGNRLELYYEGNSAFARKMEAIRGAKHHIHMEYYIFHPDETGQRFVDALCAKAREGVQVRLLYDGVGARRLFSILGDLKKAGGKCIPFLPINFFRRQLRVNLRTHRKILIVDGDVAFIGGLNIGDEYIGRVKNRKDLHLWRDTHMRIEGPTVASIQGIFGQDWHFAADEELLDPEYYTYEVDDGDVAMQAIGSGPDQEINSIKEVIFAAISRARKRLWIQSPYFVPDEAIISALRLAAATGVDVRLITQSTPPDYWLPYLASRYYWPDMIQAGVRIYLYERGMIHAKVITADGEWATVGTANADIRSMALNFEVNCIIHTPYVVADLDEQFERDLSGCREVTLEELLERPRLVAMAENISRLLSPVL